MGEDVGGIPPFLDRIIEFEPGVTYELLKPITNFRHCHDGTPAEGRIVLTCRRIQDEQADSDEYIIKIKARVPDRNPDDSFKAEETSSTTTRAELKALGAFRDASSVYAPHLVHYKQTVQDSRGPSPGGYLTFTVMTKMPGDSLHNLYYWGMSAEERTLITERFMIALRRVLLMMNTFQSIYALGIEPVDCALRNILWESETRTCTIIDFELWRSTEEVIEDEQKELRRWGLARTPAHKNHWEAWNAQWR